MLFCRKTSFHQYKAYLISHSTDDDQDETPVEVLKFLLPSLCHLTAEENARQIILEQHTHELLAEYLSFLWQNYSHLDTGTKPQLSSSNGQDSASGDDIKEKMSSLSVSEHTNTGLICTYSKVELEKRLTTLCGVLLNLIVLEMDLIKSHAMFSELHLFAMNNLAQLGKCFLSTILLSYKFSIFFSII